MDGLQILATPQRGRTASRLFETWRRVNWLQKLKLDVNSHLPRPTGLLLLLVLGCAGGEIGEGVGGRLSFSEDLSAALALLWTLRCPAELVDGAVIVGSSDCIEVDIAVTYNAVG